MNSVSEMSSHQAALLLLAVQYRKSELKCCLEAFCLNVLLFLLLEAEREAGMHNESRIDVHTCDALSGIKNFADERFVHADGFKISDIHISSEAETAGKNVLSEDRNMLAVFEKVSATLEGFESVPGLCMLYETLTLSDDKSQDWIAAMSDPNINPAARRISEQQWVSFNLDSVDL